MIDAQHPAVKAAMGTTAVDTLRIAMRPRFYTRRWLAHLIARMIDAALPHLTDDDLRQLPRVREMMAEGWDGLVESMSASGEFHDVDLAAFERLNPYREAA